MADSQSGYTEPTTPNLYLDAETTGRVATNGATIVRQRVVDPDTQVALAAISDLLAAAGGLTDTELRAVPVDVTVANPTADPETGLATQTTLAAVLAKLTADPATQTTLAAVLTELAQKLEPADLATLATAAKQDAAKAVFDSILTSVDGLEGFTDGVEGKLDTLNGKDFATEAKLETVRALLASTLTVTGPLTDTQLRAAAVAVSAASLPLPAGAATESTISGRFLGDQTPAVATLTAAGNTTVITPTVGKRLVVRWIAFTPSQDNTAANEVRVGFGPSTAITTELVRLYATSHVELFTGATNDRLIANTATAEKVLLSVHYKEIT